jgi:hypothetical protein
LNCIIGDENKNKIVTTWQSSNVGPNRNIDFSKTNKPFQIKQSWNILHYNLKSVLHWPPCCISDRNTQKNQTFFKKAQKKYIPALFDLEWFVGFREVNSNMGANVGHFLNCSGKMKIFHRNKKFD